MQNYLLLLHEDESQRAGIPHDRMMAMIKEYRDWSAKLRVEGRLVGGEKLRDDNGKVLRDRQGKVTITDGPYAESKEVVGGFFMIAAKDYAEACAIAQGCPHLKYYGRIEVREVDKIG
ncbi:MAG: YciI family protein [Alphaproteobacteria bacterium]|nr:YciI family protein [Alphaproteobacteria bacterium]